MRAWVPFDWQNDWGVQPGHYNLGTAPSGHHTRHLTADSSHGTPGTCTNHNDLRDRRPSSPRPRSGARFCACVSLPTFATGGGASHGRGMRPYLLSLKAGSLRY